MGFLNDMSHKNCDAKAIFLSGFGDLSVSHGVEGGHAVVSGQRTFGGTKMAHLHVWCLGRDVWKAGLSWDHPPEHLHVTSPVWWAQVARLLTWCHMSPRGKAARSPVT